MRGFGFKYLKKIRVSKFGYIMWKIYKVLCGENIDQEENREGDLRKRTDILFSI